MSADDLLESLNEPQRQAVTHVDGPLLVLAGPGSGKTRVITHRAAYLARTVTQPQHILAITFTNKAANEMAERLARLRVSGGLTCRTFHAFCARVLRMHAGRAGVQPNFSIFDASDQVAAMKEAVHRTGLAVENFPPSRVLAQISRLKNDMILPEASAERASGWQDERIAALYAMYQRVLAEQNALDFDDLLVATARLLGDDEELRNRLQEQYRYVLVDEYQDTNHAQYLIARGLALDHENLCVTGDPDQSIYGWRGANLHNILDFEADFPDAVVVRLEENYRSTPEILAAADVVIAHNTQRKPKTLWTSNAGGPAIRMARCKDARGEAVFVADQVARHVAAGGRYADVAVFYRVNALSRTIEATLRDGQIPYQIARGVEFYNRKEIKDALAYLRVVANPRDRVSLLRIINVPARGLGRTTVQRLIAHADATGRTLLELIAAPEEVAGIGRAAGHLRSFADVLAELSSAAQSGGARDAIEAALLHSGLNAMWRAARDEDVLANVDELVTAAAEFDRQQPGGRGSLTDWLQQISLVSDVDAVDPEVGAVTLMTLHAAKGLEFDTVFITGVEDELLPHQRSQGDAAEIEEERRLFFVGMTRARRALTISSADWREVRGAARRTATSIFLTELPSKEVEWLAVGEDGSIEYDDAGADPPRPAVDFSRWQAGQFVRHPEYGLGKVEAIRHGPRETRARIVFAEHGPETIILEYAELEPVEADELD